MCKLAWLNLFGFLFLRSAIAWDHVMATIASTDRRSGPDVRQGVVGRINGSVNIGKLDTSIVGRDRVMQAATKEGAGVRRKCMQYSG